MATIKIEGNVWRNGEHLSSFDLADGFPQESSRREFDQLVASYVMSLLAGGGTATYSRPHNEYRVVMPDGSAEYIRLPVIVP